jgi:hypothetical protein
VASSTWFSMGRLKSATRPFSADLWKSLSHEPWNHNLHRHRAIVRVIPPDCQYAPDLVSPGRAEKALRRRPDGLRQGEFRRHAGTPSARQQNERTDATA